jgi:hypothetical protein
MLYVMLPFLVFAAFLFYHLIRKVDCPDCGARLPTVMSPFSKTRRMWWEGGYLCSQCGCETDLAGRKVTADTPPARFPVGQVVAVAILMLVGVGLGTAGLLVSRTAVAAPPVVIRH